jgi:hypothetical protein
MPPIKKFDPPALLKDFPNDPDKQARLDSLWDQNANGWTRQAILGNPWNAEYSAYQTFYYNPRETDIQPDAKPIRVQWTAKPNRIDFYFPNLSQQDRWSLADTGYTTGSIITRKTFAKIPPSGEICGEVPGEKKILYGPYGPRGWQDEYCEWSVLRNDKDQIIRIDFACENPEYWYALWRIDPQRVVELYRETLDRPGIILEDLQLKYKGEVVVDKFTNQPAYNPLNKWNFGPKRSLTSGGVMHLTSGPNTLQTELQLAGGATVLRKKGNADANAFLCCGKLGQPRRNSDPTIGQRTNMKVEEGNRIALANPAGLYIQMPSFAGYEAPKGHDPAEFWTVRRGSSKPLPGFPSDANFILHAVYEVPPELGFTVSDITIKGQPIQWAAQIAATFNVALFPLPIEAVQTQEPLPKDWAPQPLQLMFYDLWEAYQGTPVENPVQAPATLAGNSIIAPPSVKPDTSYQMMLICDTLVTDSPQKLNVFFNVPGDKYHDHRIKTEVLGIEEVTYTVPGNSYPGTYRAVMMVIHLGDAEPGPRDILVSSVGQKTGIAAPAFLVVEPRS